MWYFGEAAVFTYLPSYAVSEGTPPIQAALLMTVMGAGSIVSRLITGFVAGDSSVGEDLSTLHLISNYNIKIMTCVSDIKSWHQAKMNDRRTIKRKNNFSTSIFDV